MELGEEAILAYEAIRSNQFPDLYQAQVCLLPSVNNFDIQFNVTQETTAETASNPFNSLSHEGLERHFNCLVDAKHAISLRKSAILADIGDCLQALESKISLYHKDEVFLSSATQEIRLVKEASSTRGFGINFFVLEALRSLTSNPSYGLSFVEKHATDCSFMRTELRKKEKLQHVAIHFLNDPYSVIEHRMPLFHSVQR